MPLGNKPIASEAADILAAATTMTTRKYNQLYSIISEHMPKLQSPILQTLEFSDRPSFFVVEKLGHSSRFLFTSERRLRDDYTRDS